ncbi:Pollen-specific leucine-rich repeat extensin-like protein 1, partial [Cucurbita argyrosperma subsp. argyrosperma]
MASLLLFLLLVVFTLPSASLAVTKAEVSYLIGRQLLALREHDDLPDDYKYDAEIDPHETFINERLKKAFVALKAWKSAIYSDPYNFTENWVGNDVCLYRGVFCTTALDDSTVEVVAGIDLNHADIAGYLPPELGLLTDLALFHINSNRFCGIIPRSFSKLTLMFEFDVSNNRFVGHFPEVVFHWRIAKFLDLRFNDFEGEVPPALFTMTFDAIFLNNNRFSSFIPDTIGNSTVSLVSFAYNYFHGCIPSSVGQMSSLNQVLFIGNKLHGCLPVEIGKLVNLTVLDISNNSFPGWLPALSGLKNLQYLDVSYNEFRGSVSGEICKLPHLGNFNFSFNYFDKQDAECVAPKDSKKVFDDVHNCLLNRPEQRDAETCSSFMMKSVECRNCGEDPTTRSPVVVRTPLPTPESHHPVPSSPHHHHTGAPPAPQVETQAGAPPAPQVETQAGAPPAPQAETQAGAPPAPQIETQAGAPPAPQVETQASAPSASQVEAPSQVELDPFPPGWRLRRRTPCSPG